MDFDETMWLDSRALLNSLGVEQALEGHTCVASKFTVTSVTPLEGLLTPCLLRQTRKGWPHPV